MPLKIRSFQGGSQVFLDDKLMGSPDHSTSVAFRLSSSLPQTLYLFCSPLLGWGIEDFLRNKPDNSLAVCVEFHPELHSLFHHPASVFPGLPPQSLIIAPPGDPLQICDYLQDSLNRSQIRRIQLISLSKAFRLFHASYRQLESLLKEKLATKWQNRITTIGLSRRWIKNIFTNMCHPPFSLQYSHPQAPIVVAGAGPLAEKTIKELRPLRRRFILIATDSSLPYLAEIDLPPDLIIAQDAQYWNIKDLIPFRWKHTPLLCDLVSFPAMVRKISPHGYFLSHFTETTLLQRVEESGINSLSIEALGSVGVTACRLAMRLSTGPIILTGLEFHFIPGQSHLRMSAVHRTQLQQATRLSPNSLLLSQLLRPRITVINRLQQPMAVDFVYAGYARTLQDLTRFHPRVLDSNKEGLPLTPASMDVSSLQNLLKQHEIIQGVSFFSSQAKTSVQELLQNECEMLGSFIQKPHALLLERELDYLTLDFPDHHTQSPRKLLSRAVISAADYTAHLKRLAARTHHRKEG